MSPQLPKRVIVFCLPGIGDAVQFTPALALLRRLLPAARITAITMFRGTADVLETNPDVDEVRHFGFFGSRPLAILRYVLALRREGCDLSLMTFPSNRLGYNLVNRLASRRWRAAHRYQHQTWRNAWFLNNITVTEAGTRHNVEENLELVRAIGARFGVAIPVQKPELKLVLTGDDVAYAGRYLAAHGVGADALLFGFHTYSSTFKNMHRKCWDKDNFVALIRRLGAAHPRARFLIFSGPSDEEVNQYIAGQLDARVLVIRELNLRRALAMLKRCRVFVSNDSGLLHLGAAVGAPCVALYGPTDWRRLHPWTDRHVVVRHDLPCMPCFYFSSRPLQCVANIDYACMREISVDEVFAAVQNLIAQHDTTKVPTVQT
jgi:heptosyltransferase-2